ncbi:choice-of-anchor J domain-containing protein [Flavobacterium okayamense]|uniref:DUF5017 domain-containing protein n=1 Tax=Flavobacterium okayamense TaxID=2830782 RepID=A0ABM7S2C2_9FLAO|nr:choice-of-anchor J domain-containing protein [Flavobacterium okayamense]BCY27762.1 hypothetical protein KK2020170_06300 [Flavobacterium okayamense]
MKKIVKTLIITMSSALVLTSCVKDDDYAIPTLREVFFLENFESIPDANTGNNQFISLTGWSNVSLNSGSELWEARMFDGEKYAQLSAFGTGEPNMDTWLISPAINLDNTSNEAFSFSYKAAYYNGQAVSALISTDYDGSGTITAVNNATWTDLDVTLSDYLTSGYPSNFSNSGALDISGYNGDVYIALRYVGGSSGVTTTYQIDNFKLFENN